MNSYFNKSITFNSYEQPDKRQSLLELLSVIYISVHISVDFLSKRGDIFVEFTKT